MADNRTPESRSALMSRIRQRDTAPELVVRRLLHGMGYRFRLHRRDLPGTPDIVFPSRKLALFVHGCFWHGHGCSKGRPPKSSTSYWSGKLSANKDRDARKQHELEAMGWRVETIWQCQLKDLSSLGERLTLLLGLCKRVATSGESCNKTK